MSDIELLNKVKEGLNIYGNTLDSTLTIYIDEIKSYMKEAGVPEIFISSATSVGIITIGVSDLYNKGSLSDYFNCRVNQLKYWGV